MDSNVHYMDASNVAIFDVCKAVVDVQFSTPPPLVIMSALCFLLPLVEKLSHLHSSKPAVLVLGPVRELCIQTESVAKQLMQGEVDCRMNQLVSPVPSVGCPL